MVYNYKNDYIDKVCEGKAKVEQEIAVVNKIMDLLNHKKYNDIEDFFKKNSTLQDFLKNNNMENAMKHFNTFGNPLNEEDYTKIIDRLKIITSKKQSINVEDIKTDSIENKNYNQMEIDGEQHYVISSENKSIEEKMSDVQPTSQEFQSIDEKKNAENIFKDLKSKQKGINPVLLSQININSLNEEEKKILRAAYEYQRDTGQTIKLDINNSIIVNEQNEIIKITEYNGELKFVSDENEIENESTLKSSFQKKLTPSNNTIYAA